MVGLGAASLAIQLTEECIKGLVKPMMALQVAFGLHKESAYKYFTEASHMPEDYRYLCLQIQIEQQRFISFAVAAGLLSDDEDGDSALAVRTDQSLLRNILTEIHLLFKKFEIENGRYVEFQSLNQAQLRSDSDQPTSLVDLVCRTRVMAEQNGDKRGSIAPTTSSSRKIAKVSGRAMLKVQKLKMILTEPKRLIWVSTDQETFETLIRKLSVLNSYLTTLLDGFKLERLEKLVQSSYVEILQLNNDVPSLQALRFALSDRVKYPQTNVSADHTVPEGAAVDAVEVSLRSDAAERGYVKQLTEIKIQKVALDETGCPHEDIPGLGGKLGPNLDLTSVLSPEIFTTNSSASEAPRTLQYWEGQAVWCETLSGPRLRLFDRAVQAQLTAARLEALICLLTHKLPPKFLCPPCVGYISNGEDSEEPLWALVFKMPGTVKSRVPLIDLRSLLKTGKPSLLARIRLCSALSECMYQYHAVNWLHKGLRSANVILFPQSASEDDRYSLEVPYLTGFDLSRPGDKPNMTARPEYNPSKDIYRHPKAQSDDNPFPYRKSYDMYSLGIVLLEVACWKRIDKLLGDRVLEDFGPQNLQDVRSRLLNIGSDNQCRSSDDSILQKPAGEISPVLRQASDMCGESVGEIIKLCLAADDIEKPVYSGETEAARNQRLRMVFEDQIIARLQKLVDALQGTGV